MTSVVSRPAPASPGTIRPSMWRTSAPGFEELNLQIDPDDPKCIAELQQIAADSNRFSEQRYEAMGYLVAIHNRGKADTAGLIQFFEKIARTDVKLIGIITRRDALVAMTALKERERYQVHPEAMAKLTELANDAGFQEWRREAMAALAKTHDSRALETLVAGVVEFGGSDLADGISGINLSWTEKAKQFIQTLQSSTRPRSQIDMSAILQALSTPDQPSTLRLQLEDSFIEAARDPGNQDVRMSGILAGLLIGSEAGDAEQAGNRINAYQRDHKVPESELHNLRLQVGGAAVSSILQSNLKDNFQVPITALNEYTLDWWMKALGNARTGFLVRLWMSFTVFAVGVLLLGLSSYRLLFPDPNSKGLESLAPFAAGLGTMLLIIYSGPLKDIRQSVSDLATANAVFVAYVHRILETSHTFSYLYLKEKVTFDEMAKSSSLIKEAMENTVRSLNMTAVDSSEDTIVRAMNFAMEKMKPK